MTARVWSDEHGLSIRQTTSNEHYFLDVDPKLRDVIRPFLTLDEARMTWHSLAQGYIFAKKDYTLELKAFLSNFHTVLPVEGREAKAGGLEQERKSVKSGRATVYYVSYQEVRLLMFLHARVNVKFFTQTPIPGRKSSRSLNDFLQMMNSSVSYPEDNPLNMDWEEVAATWGTILEADGFADLMYRYLNFREGAGSEMRTGHAHDLSLMDCQPDVVLKKGDVCKPFSQDYEELNYTICTGSTLIPFDHSGWSTKDGEVYLPLPSDFQCPEPFPILYWRGLFPGSIAVHPNFDKFVEQMEFTATPAIPPPMGKCYDPLYGFIHQLSPTEAVIPTMLLYPHMAALQFKIDETMYHIYFLSNKKISYDRVAQAIEDPTQGYLARTETQMVAYL